MIRLRAITWAVGIWAAAVSTLVAGLPHVQCRCPDGRVKPFCWSILFPSACCGYSCCVSPAQKENGHTMTKRPCCCQASRKVQNNPLSSEGQIRPMGCTKTIAKAPGAPRAELVRYSVPTLVWNVQTMVTSVLFWTYQPEPGLFPPSSDKSPSSSDLIIALRHLLI